MGNGFYFTVIQEESGLHQSFPVTGGAGADDFNTFRKKAVYFLDEFGATEAMWELEVEDLQATVAMDSHGESLFTNVKAASLEQLKQLCMV
jgi:tartrate dehydratase beta subunit/fumarate hydratase class I family protein